MKKIVISALLAAASLSLSPAANAATSIVFAPAMADGSFSGTFSNTGITSGDFSDVFDFTLPTGLASGTISSVFAVDTNNNVDFNNVSLNDVSFATNSTGNVEFRSLVGLPVTSGAQRLLVSGVSGGNGSYAGTLSFSPMAAVPEPATWAMMLVGFGAIGVSMRRRKRTNMAYATA